MTKLWIEWKTNGRFPTRSTVPWKSRKGGEIPTFPQLRRLLSHAQKTGEQKTEGCGRVEIQNQDSHFSTAPKACGARKVPAQHPFAPDATHTKQRGGKHDHHAAGPATPSPRIGSQSRPGINRIRILHKHSCLPGYTPLAPCRKKTSTRYTGWPEW